MERKIIKKKEDPSRSVSLNEIDLVTEIGKEWNILVLSFVAAKNSWENIKTMLIKLPSMDLLGASLERMTGRVCLTTKFHYAAESFLQLFGAREDMKDLLISDKKKEKG